METNPEKPAAPMPVNDLDRDVDAGPQVTHFVGDDCPGGHRQEPDEDPPMPSEDDVVLPAEQTEAILLAEETFAPPNPPRPQAGGLLMMQLDRLKPSKSNVRTPTDNGELIESIRLRGILQPLLVRPVYDWFEVVAGHRRLAAANKLKLPFVPVLVRAMDDSEALQAQLTENLQRVDLAPYDEAIGYGRLHNEFKLTVDDIGLRVAKSKAYVYSRLKLLDLCPMAVNALNAGKLTASTALLIARIPDAKLQQRAAEEIISAGPNKEPLSHRAAFLHLQENYMLRLADAPFQPKDDMLVMEAGSCTKCPKRSGNNPDLFGDVERADVCSDPICYRSKVDANWASEKERARAKGWDVMAVPDSRRLFASGKLPENAPWVDLDAPCQEDKQRSSWRRLFSKDVPAATLAMDIHGAVHELVARSACQALLKQLGLKEDEEKTLTPEEKAAQRAEEGVREETAQRLVADMVQAVQDMKVMDEATLRLMAMALLQLETAAAVIDHRGWEGERETQRQIEKKLDRAGLQGLVFEMATALYLGLGEHFYSDELKAACRVYGLDLKGTERLVRADHEEMVKQERTATPKKGDDAFDPLPPPRLKKGKRARA